ncbi:D-alanyl-D-alanine carboxypeptidase family protein [Streptomyces sp. NPDC006012]|uniref:D-alanyl-D-alanine carboxypeptidase family protein n=1 Tax=Streptomyces sp. NPDC006012 TaxID=3364739 RepID=UPI0036AFE934
MCPVTGPGEPEPRPDQASPSGPPFRESRMGRLRPSRLTTMGAVGVAALATLVVLATTEAGGGPAAGPARAGSPAWPAQGQAAVFVEGLGARGDLGSHGAQEPVPIASVTKVMTAYVILRDHPIPEGGRGAGITVDAQAAQESSLGAESTVQIEAGRRLSERQVLELMLIPSGGNIARMLARWDAGSEDVFVRKMNRAARDLGMTQTTYTDPSGIAPTTVSTSKDQLKLARQVMRDAVFRSVVAEREATVPGVPGTLRNTNTLLGEDGVIGVKTGSSTPAGGNLMWAASAPDRTGHDWLVLGVVLHQRAGAGSEQGLDAALSASRSLIASVRQWVAATGPAASPHRSSPGL